MSTPILNWNEITVLISQIPTPLTVGKVFVPARTALKEGFQRFEWALECMNGKDKLTFVFSVRPGLPYFYLTRNSYRRVSDPKSQSVFGITLSKLLQGSELLEITQPARERFVVLKFRGGIELVLNLIPAATEAVIFNNGNLLERSKINSSGSFDIPTGDPSRPEMAIKTEQVNDIQEFSDFVEEKIVTQNESNELAELTAKLKAFIVKQTKLLTSQKKTLEKIESESDYFELGTKLKSILSYKPRITKSVAIAIDPVTEEEVSVAIDPKRSLSENVSHYFHLAQRSKKKREDAVSQIKEFEEKLSQANDLLEQLDLDRIKSFLGITDSGAKTEKSKRSSKWKGRQFKSRDGTTICVGKTKLENLDLTFKVARGNDMWMHAKGKPSAHVVILLDHGKSASLETLLDAAQILLHFSGGNSWGKTEVDYTFKKYVKRIKGSDQVSYTQNKTLTVAPDKTRLQKLIL